MKKSSSSHIEKFEDKISFFSNKIFISLLIVGIIGLVIRILFLHIEIPINSDNFLYFRSAGDQITGYDASDVDVVYNNGWPFFLSLFFSITNSNNFMDYMALQRFLTVGISVLTIIPIYFLGKQFFSKSYAILGAAIFVFEPRIAQNSLFGITEPLYIIALTISLALIFSKKYHLQYISFVTLSCAILIRSEGLFLLPIFFTIFFIRSEINKKSFFSFFIILGIIISILLPASIIRTEQIGDDGLTDRISGGIIHITNASDDNQSRVFSIVGNGISNMLKFLAWSQIPYLIFFVPVGLILIMKSGNKYEKSLILVGISALIPTIYGYSFASDSRYLFPIYPIFCIMSVYSIKYFLQKIPRPKSIIILIFSMIIISSVLYLNWKDIDKVHELEAYNLALEISNRASTVNAFFSESDYLDVVGLTKIEKFPTPSNEYMKKRVHRIDVFETDSIMDVIKRGKENGLTHLVIDDKQNRPQFVKEILTNENSFPYLIKEFDSLEHGYKYPLKIYKIDYEKFDLVNKKPRDEIKN
jgi:hypothetical protein